MVAGTVRRRTTRRDLLSHPFEEVNFQVWLDGDTDVFTRFRSLGHGTIVVEFGLDGMTAEERETVVFAVSQVVESDRKETIGPVVDRSGRSEDTDWDNLVTGAGTQLDDWPDLLGVRPEVAAGHPQLARAQRHMDPPLLVFAASSTSSASSADFPVR
jgi:hypothetical protein